MRVRQSILAICFIVGGGLAVTSNNARATSITDANVFTGAIATSAEYYGNNPDFVPSHAVDGTSDTFVFGLSQQDCYLQIRGFDSAINTLRFYSWVPTYLRASPAVRVYYSSNSNASDPWTLINYTDLGVKTLATLESDPTSLYATLASDGYYYSDVNNLGIPTGTKSVLLKFTTNETGNTSALREVQAFIPEPSSFVLLVCGLVGLLAYAWRKRK